MVRNRQSKTLLHFVERLIFSQWILNLVVTGFEPTTIRFADGPINRHAIGPVGPRHKPFSRTSEEDPKIAKRTSLNRQFLGQVAGGRVGSGRVADCVFLQRSNFRAASRQRRNHDARAAAGPGRACLEKWPLPENHNTVVRAKKVVCVGVEPTTSWLQGN